MKKIIPAKTGVGFKLEKGQMLKVIDPKGGQVADLFCYSVANPGDTLSSGRSIDYADKLMFGEEDTLVSHAGLPMLKIIEDTCDRHDFLLTPCSLPMFQMMSGKKEYQPSCQENLEKAFSSFPVNTAQVSTTFNIFMNVVFRIDGQIKVSPPISRPGDYVVFEALMDLYVGLTACADPGSNGGSCKPIEYDVK